MAWIKKPHKFAIVYSTILIGITSFTLLDAFVIPHAQASVTSTTQVATSTQMPTNASTDDTHYKDDNISISITTTREYNTTIYTADIIVSDPSYLKTALANNTFGRNIKAATSDIAQQHNAIFAINGDYYGFRDDGAVLRNGTLYRSTTRQGDITEALVIKNDGSFSIIDETETNVATMDTSDIAQILSFGPALVNNGAITVDENDEVLSKSHSNQNPRTAIGMISPGHYVVIVTDGRTNESSGLTLLELATIMKEKGATVAYNLDGGGSSTMVFNGKVVNTPTTNGSNSQERSVSDIVYIGYE